jgi:DNA-binding NarL/FixJ family response regulator
MSELNILIADDHPVVVSGVEREARNAGFDVVGSVSTNESIIDSFRELKPDVLVCEVRICGRDTLRVIEQLLEEFPDTAVVVFSNQENPSYIARAAALGCRDYVLKSSPCCDLMKSVKQGAQGTPPAADSLLCTTKTRMRRKSAADENSSPLTSRELQVLKHVAMGLSNREIGKSLGISVETVKEHVQNILRKLDVNDRTQAAVWAVKRTLV